jgi:hypothetical protein
MDSLSQKRILIDIRVFFLFFYARPHLSTHNSQPLMFIHIIFIFHFLVSIEARQQQTGNLLFTRTTATLSEARYWLAATSSRYLVFFGGGYNLTTTYYDRIDIYNISSGS